jgi:hypothetical protein
LVVSYFNIGRIIKRTRVDNSGDSNKSLDDGVAKTGTKRRINIEEYSTF